MFKCNYLPEIAPDYWANLSIDSQTNIFTHISFPGIGILIWLHLSRLGMAAAILDFSKLVPSSPAHVRVKLRSQKFRKLVKNNAIDI